MRMKLVGTIMLLLLCAGFIFGHEVNLVEPFDGAVTSDASQRIVYNFEDPISVDEGSIQLTVNGTDYTTSDAELTWYAPNLVFIPPSPFGDGVVVNDTLTYDAEAPDYDTSFVVDSLGDSSMVIDTTYSTHSFSFSNSFSVDLSGPYMLNRNPGEAGEAEVTTVTDTLQPIEIILHEETSDIDPSTVGVRIEGVSYNLSDPALTLEDDFIYIEEDSIPDTTWGAAKLTFDPETAGISFDKMDTVQVNLVSADDIIDYGSDNHLQSAAINNWEFYVDAQGPYSEAIDPYVEGEHPYVSCRDQQISLKAWDANGIVPSTIVVEIEGNRYSIDHPRVDFDSTSGIFTFTPNPLWVNGQVVNIELLSVEDIYGNTLAEEDAASWSFTIDRTGPSVTGNYPEDNFLTTDTQQPISFQIEDEIGNIDPQTITLKIETSSGDLWRYEGYYTGIADLIPGITWTDSTNTYAFNPAEVGSTFDQGDTVYVTVTAAEDSIHYCPDNNLTSVYNWQFYVAAGPSLNIDYPEPETYSSCESQKIHLFLEDPDGIDPATVQLEVEGVVYDTSSIDTYLTTTTLPGTTLVDTNTYHPLQVYSNEIWFDPAHLEAYEDGQEINITLLSADDLLGNPMPNAPISWSYVVDKSGAYPENPSPVGYGKGPYPKISIDIVDSICGRIDSTLTTLKINGIEYYPDRNPGVYFEGNTLVADMAEEGRAFEDGEEVEVTLVHAYDNPHYKCKRFSNPLADSSYSWTFTVDYSAPSFSVVEPATDSYTACENQKIKVSISDPAGIDQSTILFEAEGRLYDTSSADLEYDTEDGNLIYTPSTPFEDGERVEYAVVEAGDALGNIAEDTPLTGYFTVDLTSPDIISTNPADGDTVCKHLTSLDVQVDDLNGYDEESVTFTVVKADTDTFAYTYEDSVFNFSDHTISLDLEAAGLEFNTGGTNVEVYFSVTDNPEYACDTYNETTHSFDFYINPGWRVDILVGDTSHVLTFGAQLNATDSIDEGIDEEAPPLPIDSTGTYAVVFLNSGTRLFTDITSLTEESPSWTIWTDGATDTLRWDPDALPEFGNFVINGEVDMRSDSMYPFSGGEAIVINLKSSMIELYEGWNLVSVPVEPVDPSIESVFPSHVGPVYSYDNERDRYVRETTVEPGEAYFVLHSADTAAGYPSHYSYGLAGTPVDTLTVKLYDGWNTFGGVYNFGGVSPAGFDEHPSGRVMWDLLYYLNATVGNYASASAVKGGLGYFVFADLPDGFSYIEVTMNSGMISKVVPHREKESPESHATLNIDLGQQSKELTVGTAKDATPAYDNAFDDALPPSIIDDEVDAHISNNSVGRMLTDIRSSSEHTWNLSIEAKHNVTLKCSELTAPEGYEYRINDGQNSLVLEQGKTMNLSPSNYTLALTKATATESPTEFTLHSNKPNPFSEQTTISYTLPEKSQVTVTVYDMLGNKITTLVNSTQDSGTKEVVWDGTNSDGKSVNPGIYYYHLEAANHSTTHKMLLTK